MLKLNDNMGMERNKCCAQRTFWNEKKLFNCNSPLARDKMYVSYQRVCFERNSRKGAGGVEASTVKHQSSQVLFCCKLQGKDGGEAGSTLEVRCLLYMHTCTFSHKTDNAWEALKQPLQSSIRGTKTSSSRPSWLPTQIVFYLQGNLERLFWKETQIRSD